MATLGDKIRIFQGLMSKDGPRIGPVHVIVDTTRRCNLQCLGCRYHSPEARRPSPADPGVQDLSFGLAKRLFEELKNMGTRRVYLLGEGEPFLHENIFGMIAEAKKLGLSVFTSTNALLFDEKKIQGLLDASPDGLNINLWASSIEDYRQQYPGADPANFEKILSIVKQINAARKKQRRRFPAVLLHHPVNRHNLKQLDAMVDLAMATGCDGISLAPFLTIQGRLSSHSLTPDEEKTLYAGLQKIRKRLDALSMKHNIPRMLSRHRDGKHMGSKTLCYAGWFHARIRVDGTVSPCGPLSLILGDLKKESFREIWNGPAYQKLRRQLLTPGGLEAFGQKRDCEFCCVTQDSVRIHRLVKGLLPIIRKRHERQPPS